MVQLRCTKKVLDALGIKPSELFECKEVNSLLGNWYVNLFNIDRRKALLFMSEKTLFSFMLFGVKKTNIKDMPLFLLNGLTRLLQIEGFTEKQINEVISDFKNMEITKTNSRSVLGNLNDLKNMYEIMIYHDGGLKHCDLGTIILKINRTPQRNLGWKYSIDVVKEIIEKRATDNPRL
jgi:hypothetical protein